MFDEHAEERFGLFGVSVGDDVFELVGDGGEVGGVRACGRLCRDAGGEVEVLLVQFGEAAFERGDAGLESLGVQVALLEGGVVAVDGSFGTADLFGETAALFLEGGSVGVPLLGRGLDRLVDDVAVAVEGGELGDDGGFELVARDAFAVAAFRAELLAAGAGVVVVGAAVAFSAHADVGAFAASAAQKTGEQVVAGVAAAQGHVLALAQQPLRTREGHLVDERFMQTGKALAAPDDAAEIGLVF